MLSFGFLYQRIVFQTCLLPNTLHLQLQDIWVGNKTQLRIACQTSFFCRCAMYTEWPPGLCQQWKNMYSNVWTLLCHAENFLFMEKKVWTFHVLIWYFVAQYFRARGNVHVQESLLDTQTVFLELDLTVIIREITLLLSLCSLNL